MLSKRRPSAGSLTVATRCALLVAVCSGCSGQSIQEVETTPPSRVVADSDEPLANAEHADDSTTDAEEAESSEQDTARPSRNAHPALEVAVGARHACVLLGKGTVRCWDWADEASTAGAPSPRVVEPLSDIIAISAGGGHTCALDRNGVLRCWGANNVGQLGDGTRGSRTDPVEITGLRGITNFDTGGAHTCAVTKAGRVSCWGENGAGQLGNGTKLDSARPSAVRRLKGASKVFAGDQNTCALQSGNTVRCWGDNHYRQIGPCGRPHIRTIPMKVARPAGAAGIAVGEAHLCTRSPSREIDCRGGRAPVVDLEAVEQVAVGLRGSGHCVLLHDGEVQCWGMAGAGCHSRNLGFGPGGFDCEPHGGQPADDVFCLTPIAIALELAAVQIDVGETRACAVLEDGGVWCWSMDAPTLDRLQAGAHPPRAYPVIMD